MSSRAMRLSRLMQRGLQLNGDQEGSVGSQRQKQKEAEGKG